MRGLIIKRADGSMSRWNAKEVRLGNVRWTISKYGKDGYYRAIDSQSGECTVEDWYRNVEAVKNLASVNGFEVVTA